MSHQIDWNDQGVEKLFSCPINPQEQQTMDIGEQLEKLEATYMGLLNRRDLEIERLTNIIADTDKAFETMRKEIRLLRAELQKPESRNE